MNLRIWNWDFQRFDVISYPNEMFEPFLDWLMTTKGWIEHPDLINAKVLGLQKKMLEFRSTPDTHRETEGPVESVDREAEIQNKRLVSLAKARAARKAKREFANVR